jgi:outer membrane protein OmpA-like peptidoglycan-associated protein
MIKKNKSDVQILKIYRATLVNGEWTNIEDLSINSDVFSNAHPTLNADESILYFVSNRPESIGQTDIYFSKISEDGTLGNVVNLGYVVNTEGRESFPYITDNDELYFSSDGHYGLGGYDVFYVNLNDKDTQLINVGKPINSAFDDIAFVINNETKQGFISSNRKEGKGLDDIYGFIEAIPISEIIPKTIIYGRVTNKRTHKPVVNATVILNDLNNHPLKTVKTEVTGKYEFHANRDTQYLVSAFMPSYIGDESHIVTELEENVLNLELQQDEYKIKTGDDITHALNLQPIYFVFDKYNIRPDSEIELQKVIALLNTHPKLKIDIRSHTDSRADDIYNMQLSNKRADSTANYIIIRGGIEASRITGKGYGETQLVNKCYNGITCSEEEHEQNRRSEFIVHVEK